MDQENTYEKRQANTFLNLHDFIRKEKAILSLLVVGFLHRLFYEICNDKCIKNQPLLECYIMDRKIIQFVIHQIIETGEYTLEGIAYYTHIPFDIVYDSACGINQHLSITVWGKIIDLYLQVKPEVRKVLIDKILDMNDENCGKSSLSLKKCGLT